MSGFGPNVTATDCTYFAPVLREALRFWSRDNGVTIPDATWQTVLNIETLADVENRGHVNATVDTSTVKTLSSATVGSVEVTVSQAAKLEGRCRQAVWARVSIAAHCRLAVMSVVAGWCGPNT